MVVPFQAVNPEGNVGNLSANMRVKTRMDLVVVECDPGPPVVESAQTVTAGVPNWLRIVMYYAGATSGLAEHLPAEVHVPVRLDPRSGAIVEVDVDQAATELAAHRDVAVKWWKEDEAPLADLRAAVALPGDAIRGVKGLAGAWRGALSGLRDDPAPEGGTHSAQEAEQLRRTSNMLKHSLARKPKQLAKVRASALQAGPMMAVNVKGGSMSAADFESWLQFQLTSGAISAEERQEWRRDAGLT